MVMRLRTTASLVRSSSANWSWVIPVGVGGYRLDGGEDVARESAVAEAQLALA